MLKRTVAALATAQAVAIPFVPAVVTADSTVIGVDGTRVNLPIDLGPHALDFDHGAFKNQPDSNDVTVAYPGTFGLMTLGGPNYDDSVAEGKMGTMIAIKLAKGNPTTVICYSQGADACSQANAQLREEGVNQSNVTYWMLGNVDNADGGAKTRMNIIGIIFGGPLFIPGPGVTLGNVPPTSSSDAHINQVSYEYDGFARAPKYPINLLADLNALVGTALEHGNYAQANPYTPDNVVSTTPDGGITNIMIPVKEVPLLTVAKMFGMPQPVVNVLNPTLKAVIDTAYDPTPVGPGAYPTKAQPFALLPSPTKFQTDVKNVQRGLAESGRVLMTSMKPVTSALAPLPKAKPSLTAAGNLFKPAAKAGQQSASRAVTSAIKTVSKALGGRP